MLPLPLPLVGCGHPDFFAWRVTTHLDLRMPALPSVLSQVTFSLPLWLNLYESQHVGALWISETSCERAIDAVRAATLRGRRELPTPLHGVRRCLLHSSHGILLNADAYGTFTSYWLVSLVKHGHM